MPKKVYKYKQLAKETDLDRIRQMICGNFWFSKFHQQNDPMEGVYWHLLRDELKKNFVTVKNSYEA